MQNLKKKKNLILSQHFLEAIKVHAPQNIRGGGKAGIGKDTGSRKTGSNRRKSKRGFCSTMSRQIAYHELVPPTATFLWTALTLESSLNPNLSHFN